MSLNDISLTAGMRNNLLSLQSTTTLLDRTQERLSTGKKVNTALDNPTNFFAAQSHTQRAADLTVRKDGMTEAVQGVQAANKGISALTGLIEAAKGLSQAARSADTTNRNILAQQYNTIRTQIDQLASDSGYKGKNFLGNDELVVLFNENGGSSLTISGFDASASGMGIAKVTIAKASTSSTASGANVMTGSEVVIKSMHTATLVSGNQPGTVAATGIFVGAEDKVVSGAEVKSGTEGFFLNLTGIHDAITGFDKLATGLLVITAVYVNGEAQSGGAVAKAQASISGIAISGTQLSGIKIFLSGLSGLATGASISFGITVKAHTTGGEAASINMNVFELAAGDIKSGLDIIYAKVRVSGQFLATGAYKLSGNYIVFTGTAIPPSGEVTYEYNSGFVAGGDAATTNKSIFTGQTLTAGQAITAVQVSGIALTTGFTTSGKYIKFTGNSVPTSGQEITYTVTTTTAATTGGWDTDAGIDASVNNLNTAIETLRTKSANLASNLNVVTIREDFTDGMVNTLLKGADNLTLADMNEEGANMLMLQTRQQLGTTSLKMASDAAQSVLRLF